MNKKLIAIDLDGTLLKDWETITDETVHYLRKLKEAGHILVIATGRPYRSSVNFYDAIGLNTPLINYNGGLVTSKNDPNFVDYSLYIDKDHIIDIFNKNVEHIENAFCEIKDDIYLLKDDERIEPLLHNFNGAQLHVGQFEDTLPGPTNGFIIIAKKNQGKHIEDYIKANHKEAVLSRNWGDEYRYIIEVFTPETNKGNALEYVAKYYNIPREDVIAFGDAHNDLEMITYAGTGIAMANATDELKGIADMVTEKTNQENGLIEHLKKLFN